MTYISTTFDHTRCKVTLFKEIRLNITFTFLNQILSYPSTRVMSFLKANFISSIVITGGSSGIGLALAKQFVLMNHEVFVVGKDSDELAKVKGQIPKLITLCFDVSDSDDRVNLFEYLKLKHPQVNVLINCADICLMPAPSLLHITEQDWKGHNQEFETNLQAAMHITNLFLRRLKKKKHALVVNVTSACGHVPSFAVDYAFYSATKAALHSFTQSLREQLKESTVRVVEIVPPISESVTYDFDTYARDTVEQLLMEESEIHCSTDNIVRYTSVSRHCEAARTPAAATSKSRGAHGNGMQADREKIGEAMDVVRDISDEEEGCGDDIPVKKRQAVEKIGAIV